MVFGARLVLRFARSRQGSVRVTQRGMTLPNRPYWDWTLRAARRGAYGGQFARERARRGLASGRKVWRTA